MLLLCALLTVFTFMVSTVQLLRSRGVCCFCVPLAGIVCAISLAGAWVEKKLGLTQVIQESFSEKCLWLVVLALRAQTFLLALCTAPVALHREMRHSGSETLLLWFYYFGRSLYFRKVPKFRKVPQIFSLKAM